MRLDVTVRHTEAVLTWRHHEAAVDLVLIVLLRSSHSGKYAPLLQFAQGRDLNGNARLASYLRIGERELEEGEDVAARRLGGGVRASRVFAPRALPVQAPVRSQSRTCTDPERMGARR